MRACVCACVLRRESSLSEFFICDCPHQQRLFTSRAGRKIYRLRPLTIIKLLLIKVWTDNDGRRWRLDQEALQSYLQAIIGVYSSRTDNQFPEAKMQDESMYSAFVSSVTCG